MISWRAEREFYEKCKNGQLTFVILEDLLDGGGGVVVNITDNVGVHDTGGGLKWVDSGVETQLGDGTGQDSGGIQLEGLVSLG